MAVQTYIGWATGVNQTVLDSTTFTFGENALKTDELENGLKRSRKRSAFNPDKFPVKMVFDWVNEVVLHVYDVNGNYDPAQDIHTGKTEFQLFTEWYKYRHKYGSVPFEFPKILYSQNTGITVIDEQANNSTVEYYKITSAVNGNKSGECIEVDMTWESVYGGIVEITQTPPEVVGLIATTDYCDIMFAEVSETAPVAQMFTLYIDNTQTEMSGFCYDGSKAARIYYPHITPGNNTTVTFAISDYAGLTVPAGTYSAIV